MDENFVEGFFECDFGEGWVFRGEFENDTQRLICDRSRMGTNESRYFVSQLLLCWPLHIESEPQTNPLFFGLSELQLDVKGIGPCTPFVVLSRQEGTFRDILASENSFSTKFFILRALALRYTSCSIFPNLPFTHQYSNSEKDILPSELESS